MVAVYNTELLSWYLITLKLRDTLIQNHPKSIEEAEQCQAQQQQQAQQKHHSQPLQGGGKWGVRIRICLSPLSRA